MALSHRQPFSSYTVEFVSGEKVEVDHPEALIVRAGVAVYLGPDGAPAWFDHAGVSRVVGDSAETSSAGTQSGSA